MTTTTTIPNVGDRVYYTGDAANLEGFGRCVALSGDLRTPTVTVELDARPELPLRRISFHAAAFEAGPGRRCWRYSEWRDERARRLAEGFKLPMESVISEMTRGGWDFSAQ
jgi:hypothetical protein